MVFLATAYLAAQSTEELAQLFGAHAPLGYHPETCDALLLPDADRYAGTYIIGVQGAGKSGLLHTLIHRDARAGQAVVVLDPHGDLINHCIASLPAARLPHTYVLDLEDEAYPFGANLFSSGRLQTDVARTTAVDRILHVFEVLWADVLSQQNLPRYVRAATITLLANPGSTLVDMYAFLLDADVRARLLRNVTDPTVRQFWASQYDELSASERTRRVQPLLNRLEALFMGRALVRNIVGQKRSTISFRRAIEQREIIFIKLPIKTLAQDARLIGTILLSQLSAAVFSFGDLPASERPGVSLYVDEAQNFSTPDFAALFSEGRKFGMRMTLAHQYRGQLPDYLRQSTMTARTKVVFQTTPEDGRELAHLFPNAGAGLTAEDMEPRVAEYLLTYGADAPVVQDFIDDYLRPLQGHRHGRQVKIRDAGWRPYELKGLGALLGLRDIWSGHADTSLDVPDPTPYLSSLLYEVMRTGTAALPIPREIPRGFANAGRGFFARVRLIGAGDARLQPAYPFPAWLGARVPEDGGEQLLHFLATVRGVMDHLAAHPLGTAKPASTTEIGRMLTQLPRRAAFVRSGEHTGVIYTHDTPERVQGAALQERLDGILAQSRLKYAHPREDVESGMTPQSAPQPEPTEPAESAPEQSGPLPEAPEPPQHSRWDDLEEY